MRVVPDRSFVTSTYKIKGREGTGSSIQVLRQGESYLITAAHVVDGIQPGDSLPVRNNAGWEDWSVKDVISNKDGFDCILLKLAVGKHCAIPFELLATGYPGQGQDFLQCGFPRDLEVDGAPDQNGYPIPLVKSSICSGFVRYRGVYHEAFDSYSNKGFSGGPIIGYQGPNDPKNLRLFGIVVRHIQDSPLPVMHNEGVPEADGAGKFVMPNSGFMLSCPTEAFAAMFP